jgi:hypothetical protein
MSVLDTASTIHSFNAQVLANVVWAIAKMGDRDKAFVSKLLKEAEPRLKLTDFTALANTAYALAILGRNDAAFMGALLVAARPKLDSFTGQALANMHANMAWALATLDYHDAEFMGALLVVAAEPHWGSLGQLSSSIAQDVSTMAWALATLDYHDAEFMGALLVAAKPKLPSIMAKMRRADQARHQGRGVCARAGGRGK